MANIRLVISLHDNDFWLDMHLLGEFVTNTMQFLSSNKIDENLLSDDVYKNSLRNCLVELLISIYRFRYIVNPRSELTAPFDLVSYNKETEHVADWFKSQFDLYLTDDEFSKAMEFIEVDSLSKDWHDIRYFDEFQMCNGNYEFLIIHCCDWEHKFILV